MRPSKHKMTKLSQIFKLIPLNLIPKEEHSFGINPQSRVFSPTSHVLSLVFGPLTHAIGLNDICDPLRNHRRPASVFLCCDTTGLCGGIRIRGSPGCFLTLHDFLDQSCTSAKTVFQNSISKMFKYCLNERRYDFYGMDVKQISQLCLLLLPSRK